MQGDVALGSSSASAVLSNPTAGSSSAAPPRAERPRPSLSCATSPTAVPTPPSAPAAALTDFDPATNDSVTELSLLPDGRVLAAARRVTPSASPGTGRTGSPTPPSGPAGDGRCGRPRGSSTPSASTPTAGRLLVAGQGRNAGAGRSTFRAPAQRRRRPRPNVRPAGGRGHRPRVDRRVGGGRGVRAGRDTVVVAGASGSAFTLVRYLPDGRLDPAFGAAGVTRAGPDLGGAHDLAQLPDGRLILVGERLAGDFREVAVALYHPDGRLDTTFGAGGAVGTDVSTGHNDGAASALYPGCLCGGGHDTRREQRQPECLPPPVHGGRPVIGRAALTIRGYGLLWAAAGLLVLARLFGSVELAGSAPRRPQRWPWRPPSSGGRRGRTGRSGGWRRRGWVSVTWRRPGCGSRTSVPGRPARRWPPTPSVPAPRWTAARAQTAPASGSASGHRGPARFGGAVVPPLAPGAKAEASFDLPSERRGPLTVGPRRMPCRSATRWGWPSGARSSPVRPVWWCTPGSVRCWRCRARRRARLPTVPPNRPGRPG